MSSSTPAPASTIPSAAPNNVHIQPPTSITLLITGAGIGGLLLALESQRLGHTVRILEKTPTLDPAGDTFSIVPPGLATLRHYPALHAEFERRGYDAVLSLWRFEGRRLGGVGEAWWNQGRDQGGSGSGDGDGDGESGSGGGESGGSGHAARGVRVPFLSLRRAVAEMVWGELERAGVRVEFGREVVGYGEDLGEGKGWVRLRDGEVCWADVVVAADGVGTKSHECVTGRKVRAESSGYAVYRGMIPREGLEERLSKEACEALFCGERPEFRVYMGPNTHSNIIITPDFVSYVLTHPDTGGSEESWRSNVSADTVLKTMKDFPGWDPKLEELISQTPEGGCIDWKLVWRDPQPKWVSDGGRVVQLGDAAHSFLPTSGNGATQAMEDALSLATCLRLGGKSNVHIATKVHSKLRFERVSTLQHFGFVNRQMMHHLDLDAVEKDPSLLELKMGKWIWAHDPVQYAIDNFEAARQHFVQGSPFENTNLPPGYKYAPWTIAEEMEKERQGTMSVLKETGDWN